MFYLKYDQIDKLCVCTNINIDAYKKPLVSLFIAYWKLNEIETHHEFWKNCNSSESGEQKKTNPYMKFPNPN